MSIQDHLSDMFLGDIQAAIEEILPGDIGSTCDKLPADHIAEHIFNRLRKNWGGSKIYIPAPDRSAMRSEIKQAFKGKNHAEICDRFGISLSTLYRMLK